MDAQSSDENFPNYDIAFVQGSGGGWEGGRKEGRRRGGGRQQTLTYMYGSYSVHVAREESKHNMKQVLYTPAYCLYVIT